MSALDAFLDPTRIAAMLSDDAAMGIAPAKLRAFRVVIGPKESPRLDFNVLAPSSTVAFMQHCDLAEVDERVTVLAVGDRS